MNERDDTDEERDQSLPTLEEVLSSALTAPLDPPVIGQRSLPIGQLEPPVFERLVAEIAMRVDAQPYVHIFGRSGQAQGGLDLYAGPASGRTVYQVKRLVALTATQLRAFVELYAGPPRRLDTTPVARWRPRRLEAVRFVLATAAPNDEAVDRELDKLQAEYHGDLDIELWRSTELSQMLVNRGPLVASIFGRDWARVVCDYDPPADTPPIPSGRALLNDPIVIHGLGGQRDQAESLSDSDPSQAAALYGALSADMAARGFGMLATQIGHRRRDLLVKAGEGSAAVEATVELLLEAHQRGRRAVHEVGPFSALTRLARVDPFSAPGQSGEVADDASSDAETRALVAVISAITLWADQGYTVAPVAEALNVLLAADNPFADRLLAAVCEQVIADDDPADEATPLSAALDQAMAGRPSGLLGVRLECARADLGVRGGDKVDDAYAGLLGRARRAGFDDPGHEALALRRAGYAFAASGESKTATELFQSAVRSSSEAALGGDSRDALRAVADLTTDMYTEVAARTASTATGNDARLLQDAVSSALSALEHLADDHRQAALAHAVFEARTWQRIERTSGAWVEERIAHRRYGQILLRGERADAALFAFIRAGERVLAETAASRSAYSNVTQFLRGNPKQRRPACAVTVAQADLVPDDDVDDLCQALLELVEHDAIDPAKDALRALSEIGDRLPPAVARRLPAVLDAFIRRDPDESRYGDQEALRALGAVARGPDPEAAAEASLLLVEALRARIPGAVQQLVASGPIRLEDVESLTVEDTAGEAATVLAWWNQPHPRVLDAARAGAERLLAHPLGPRNNHSYGTSAGDDARALLCAYSHRDAPALDAPAASHGKSAGSTIESVDPVVNDELVAAVVGHLLAWAEDHHDLAPSRSEALSCLRLLCDATQPGQRSDAHRRLMSLSAGPALHPHDLLAQRSTGPFNFFTMRLGSEHLASEALATAALFATSADEIDLTLQLIGSELRLGSAEDADVRWQASALHHLALRRHVPIESLVDHPAPLIRAVAADLWTDTSPYELLEQLAEDQDARVRRAVARALTRADRAARVDAMLARLRCDPSAAVRRLVAR